MEFYFTENPPNQCIIANSPNAVTATDAIIFTFDGEALAINIDKEEGEAHFILYKKQVQQLIDWLQSRS